MFCLSARVTCMGRVVRVIYIYTLSTARQDSSAAGYSSTLMQYAMSSNTEPRSGPHVEAVRGGGGRRLPV